MSSAEVCAILDDDPFVMYLVAREIEAGSETVVGIWPVRKSKTSKLVKRLRLL